MYGKILNGQMLHGQMLHGQMLRGQMLHGQILHGQMVLGHLPAVMDGSTNLKYPPRYFSWGGVLKIMLIQSSYAGAGTELVKMYTPGLTHLLAKVVSAVFLVFQLLSRVGGWVGGWIKWE